MSAAFRRAQWAAVVAAVMTCVAMLLYPGGTGLDGSTHGYSLTRNFLSDLGMTVAWNGSPNTAGAALFVASIAATVAGFGAGALALGRLCWRSSAARRPAQAASIVAVMVCALFIGVALTPENRAMALHVRLTLLAFRLLPLAALLLLLTTLRSGLFPRRAAVAWGVLSAILAAYVVLLGWGPSVRTPEGLVVMVVAQKLVALAAAGAVVYQMRLAERVGSVVA